MNTRKGGNIWWDGDERNPRGCGGRTGEPGKSGNREPPGEETEAKSGMINIANADPAGLRAAEWAAELVSEPRINRDFHKRTGEVINCGGAYGCGEESGRRRSST